MALGDQTSCVFVGHAAVGFALLAGAAALAGVDRRRAIALGVVAAAFATAPDVDILYALVGLVRLSTFGLWSAVDAFWETGNVVHRTVTHSLVVGAPAAVGVALATAPRWRVAGGALAVGLVAWVGLAGGVLAAATVVAFLAVAGVVALLAVERYGFGPRAVFAAAAVGFLSHPFGDLFTGEPPPLLFPLEATLVTERLALSAVDTLQLLGAFWIELATLWLAAVVYARLRGFELAPLVDRRAVVGVGYGAAALVLPAPTLETSYHFVFSVVAFAGIGVVPVRALPSPDSRRAAVLTGLAAVTLAGAAYTVAYLAVG